MAVGLFYSSGTLPAGGVGPAPETPLTIPGMVFFTDARNQGNFSLRQSGSDLFIEQASDLSGNGNHFIQTAPANQFEWRNEAFGGVSGSIFMQDSPRFMLRNQSILNGQNECTIFFMWKTTTTQLNSLRPVFLDSDSSTSEHTAAGVRSNFRTPINVGPSASARNIIGDGSAFNDGAPHMALFTFGVTTLGDGKRIHIYRDGSLISTGDGSSAAIRCNNGRCQLGAGWTGSATTNHVQSVHVNAIGVYTRRLSTGERDSLWAWAAGRGVRLS